MTQRTEGNDVQLIPKTKPTDGHGAADAWLVAPVNPKFPPQTCAYEFRLWANPNVINGYSLIGYTEATEHVTFLCPQAPAYKVLATKNDVPIWAEVGGWKDWQDY